MTSGESTAILLRQGRIAGLVSPDEWTKPNAICVTHSVKPGEKTFLNGDAYVGTFKGMVPHGKGKYTWSDGTVYEGDWEGGLMTGKGKMSWSSKGTYQGDFSGGHLHGFGTFTGNDGSIYTGAWRMNIQHGVGKKQYCNSDTYEGSWREGLRHGTGRYSWVSGNTYTGNWKDGTMCGRGFMRWTDGDTFDGIWQNGFRHGSGIYRFTDGGYYCGTWSRELKDGKGTFYPAGSKDPPLKKWYSSIGFSENKLNLLSGNTLSFSEDSKGSNPVVNRSLSERISASGFLGNSGQISHRASSLDEDGANRNVSKHSSFEDVSCIFSQTSEEDLHDISDSSSSIFEREYMQGVLIKEKKRSYNEMSHKSKRKNRFCEKETKEKSYLRIWRENRSYYLRLNLQLGIRYTVGKITPVPTREVRSSDFGERARIRMYFPRNGSQFTPSHNSIDFYWKDYCPMVFRNLREMFKLDAAEYMMSICGDDGLREISSPGKSGSIFYISEDDRFVIKTLKDSELKVLLKMLPEYYDHVGKYENTLITKFFGLHQITVRGCKKVRFIVMGNMFCTELRIHRRYDLKGSSLGRCTNKAKISENTTLKDLDLCYEFQMDPLLRDTLFTQIYLDCKFLETQEIIDYSFLLGLHFRAPEHLKALLEHPEKIQENEISDSASIVVPVGEPVIVPQSLLLVTHEPSSARRSSGPHIRGKALRAFSVGEKEVDLLLPETGRVQVQLGVNMPAKANHKIKQDEGDSSEVELFEVYDVILYFGIIDILQEYNLKKKAEHAYKSVRFDPFSISVVEPKLYSRRFINFLDTKVFPEQL